MTTALRLVEPITREDRGMEGNYVLYGSSCAQITEETEYIKKPPFQVPGNELEAEKDMLNSSYGLTMAKMKATEQQLLVVKRENEILKIKLDATREGGAQSLRHASQSLYENYYCRSEELKKKHEDDKQRMQTCKLEQEKKFKQNLENVNCVTERLEEKYSRIGDMEKLVQRMEEEKKALIEKKRSFEEKLLEISNTEDTKSCLDLQVEISTLQEQISHLQHVIQSQHQSLRSVIQEIEELNNELQNQDKKIKNMKEKINILQAQNKELKCKVEFWSGQSKLTVSKSVSTISSRIDVVSPYALLARLRKQNG
ncbi:coiled-coil domain-containing protein 68 isoform X2 [Emydura macquarii macquarii]|uniref:coiled-coil domain-containing protein 68 isoform X2 n=1 Tax=Emydura macquarii macquarii TaxID=1129001 RepID=UPI00352B741D